MKTISLEEVLDIFSSKTATDFYIDPSIRSAYLQRQPSTENPSPLNRHQRRALSRQGRSRGPGCRPTRAEAGRSEP
jgi:hypothetical protein